VIILSNRLKTALSKGIVFSYATIGSISMFLLGTMDFNKVVGGILFIIGIGCIFYDFLHS
jgi:hypothetical protein